MPETARRLALMRAFAESYRDRHFEDAHYDTGDGYLQTTLSDGQRMPLRFFVDVLDIRYDTETLRAMQTRPLLRPRGKELAAHEPTAAPIARIRCNLDALLTRI